MPARSAILREYRFHGRGGQGVVLFSRLVARYFFTRGLHVRELPKFGVERRGAPVEGYLRVGDAPIALATQVSTPDAVVVMGESLLSDEVRRGLRAGALVLVDSARRASELATELAGLRASTVDAGAIARAHALGSPAAPLTNTALFGAFVRLLGGAAEELEPVLRAELARPARDLAAARDGFDAVASPILLVGELVVPARDASGVRRLDELPEIPHARAGRTPPPTGAWRTLTPRFRFKRAPCEARCPAGNDVRGFVRALAREGSAAALARLLETTPFPGTCGRVCPYPCESECNRAALDSAVSVRGIERAIEEQGDEPAIMAAAPTGRRVGIIGAGPAGLSAAWQLARRGHAVRVYEAAPLPGGLLALGIPAFRLPRVVLEREIARILRLGVELRCDTRVGRDVQLEQLLAELDAVLVAVGQGTASRLDLPGEAGTAGVVSGLDFLRAHNLGPGPEVGGEVVVVGGGNTAIDAAAVCLRHTRRPHVTIVYRRTRAEMPALRDELEQLLAEGARLIELTAPLAIVAGAEGRARALACERMALAELDAGGRPRPVAIPGSRFELACDHVIVAAGQSAALPLAAVRSPKLWVAGDATGSGGTVAAAIGSGRDAALAIHVALGGAGERLPDTWAPRTDEVVRFARMNRAYFARAPRQEPPRLPVAMRLEGEREVVGGLEEPSREAERCLACGSCTGCDNCRTFCPEPAVVRAGEAFAVQLEWCKGCGLCSAECPRGVIDMLAEGA